MTTPERDEAKISCMRNEGVLSRVIRSPMATATDISELLVCSGSVKNEPANWIVTTWIKTVNTETRYPLMAISAMSAVLGSASRRKIKGERTAPSEIMIRREMYMSRRTMATIRKIRRKIRMINGAVPLAIV